MACDIIESAVMDADDELRKSDGSLRLSTFDDILEIGKMAREKLRFLNRNSGYMDDSVWGTKCDDFQQGPFSDAEEAGAIFWLCRT